MAELSIVLPPLAAPVDELWHVLLDLAEELDVPWTLVGGQMVLLHALEHGRTPIVVSQDGDMLADIRAEKRALKKIVDALGKAGFEPEHAGDDLAHRYVRESRAAGTPLMIDLLAPEGVGEKADLTTSSPSRTVQAPGGTQSLNRTENVLIVHEGRKGRIPRPTLVAAIVIKAAAVSVPGDPARHMRDLALLCALVEDPFAAAEELGKTDRRRLRLADALDDDNHPAWRLVPNDLRRNGQIAYGVLSGTAG